MVQTIFLFSYWVYLVASQQAGTLQPEVHPPLTWKSCLGNTSCVNVPGKVTLDADYRWMHSKTGFTECYSNQFNFWNPTICPNNIVCAQNCALEGANYAGTHGITTSSSSIQLRLKTQSSTGTQVGSRVYLLDNDIRYKSFNLVNKEIRFDVDVSTLPCGIRASLKLLAMDNDGGVSKGGDNKVGAKYGAGFCDASCSRRVKFINGQGNVVGWTPDGISGAGNLGSCCTEVDVFSGNALSAALNAHPCNQVGQSVCSNFGCGNPYTDDIVPGTCDAVGCDLNSYRLGEVDFYGPGKTVDTTRRFTVVTQFIGSPIQEIKRFYVQNSIKTPTTSILTSNSCAVQKNAFGELDQFNQLGGLHSVTNAFQTSGMVLALSITDDPYEHNLRIDGTYPVDAVGNPGAKRGPCTLGAGGGATLPVEPDLNAIKVVFGDVRIGDIGSTA